MSRLRTRGATKAKQDKALALHLDGSPLADVARELGVSRSWAYKLIDAAIDDQPRENAERLRAVLHARYERLHRKLTRIADDETNDVKVRSTALDRAGRNAERQARLHRLEQPIVLVAPPPAPTTRDYSQLDADELERLHQLLSKVQVADAPPPAPALRSLPVPYDVVRAPAATSEPPAPSDAPAGRTASAISPDDWDEDPDA